MERKINNKLVLISGPTGTGKTRQAIELAKKFNGELISADSRQVYVGLDYGTNKFGNNQKDWFFDKKKKTWFCEGIPVYLYDIIYPNQKFSVFEFVKKTNQLIESIWKKNKLPIIVGGTGFYQRALIHPFEALGIPADYRLRKKLEKLTELELINILQKTSVHKLSLIDLKNRRKLIRAIEVASFQGRKKLSKKLEFDYYWIGLTAPKEVLFQNAVDWINKVSKKSLPQETLALIKKGYINTPTLNGMIYKPTTGYLNGAINFDDYQAVLISQLKDYIKRQLTWFKKQVEINWFEVGSGQTYTKLEKAIQTWLNKRSNI